MKVVGTRADLRGVFERVRAHIATVKDPYYASQLATETGEKQREMGEDLFRKYANE